MPNDKKNPIGKRKPIIVSNPNDPRLRAYQDSLNLFNSYQMQDKLMGPTSKPVKDKIQWTTKELKEGRKQKWEPLLNKYISTDYQSEQDQFKQGFNPWTARKEDKKLIAYYKSLGFTDKNIMYHSSPDVVSDKIKAIGTYNDGTALSPIYKKPEQPVEYRKENIPTLTPKQPKLNIEPYVDSLVPLPANQKITPEATPKKFPGGSGKFARYPNMKNELGSLETTRMVNSRKVKHIVPTFENGVNLVAGGEKHRVYVKKSPTGVGKGVKGHVMVNHPTEDKGKWDTIDLTEKAGAKTVEEGKAATRKWHAENPYVSGAKSVKQYRGDENLPEAKNGMKNCGCKHPKTKYKRGTKGLTDPPPSKVYDYTYRAYEGDFNLDPYKYEGNNIAGTLNKLTKKSGKENYFVPEHMPSNLNWTKDFPRLDSNGNPIKGTSLYSDLGNPLHVMYHKDGTPNFIYKQNGETEKEALKRGAVEITGPMSKNERERYLTQKSQTPYFTEEQENKIIEDYIKRNNYKREDLGYKYGTGALTIPEGSAIVTANGGKNMQALKAYKKGNYKLLNKIIEQMPEDNVDKAQGGKQVTKVKGKYTTTDPTTKETYQEQSVLGGKGYGREMSLDRAQNLYNLSDEDFERIYGKNKKSDTYKIEKGRREAVKKGNVTYNVAGKVNKDGTLMDYASGYRSKPAESEKVKEEETPKETSTTTTTTTTTGDKGTGDNNTFAGDKKKGNFLANIPSMAEIAARTSILGQGIAGVPENYLKLGRYRYASQLPKTLREIQLAEQGSRESARDIVAGDAGRYLAQAGNLSAARMKAANEAVIQDTLARQDILNKNVDKGDLEAQFNTGLKNQYAQQRAMARAAYDQQLIGLGQRIDSATETAQEMSNQRDADEQRMQILKDLGQNYEYKNINGLLQLVPKVPVNAPPTTTTTPEKQSKKGLKKVKAYKRR
jgi:hypothetical protein